MKSNATSSIALCSLIAVSCLAIAAGAPAKNVKRVYMNSVQSYSSFNEMIDSADLIAIIDTRTPFEDAKSKFTRSQMTGTILDFSSSRKYEVKKLIYSKKGIKKGDIIEIEEDVARSESDKNGIITEMYMINYSPMLNKTRYMIFASLQSDGSYRIFNGRFGKFNTTGRDLDEDEQKLKWKDRAMLKFNK